MFVGYEIKAQQNQAKPVVLETDTKLSQAVLDPSKGGKKEPICLMVEYDKKQFIIAVLDPTRSWQCPLDLMFSAGSEVKFFVKGSGTVHVTGYEYRDDMDSELGFDTSSDEEGEEEEEEKLKPAEKTKTTEKRVSKIEAKSAKTNGVSKAVKKDTKKPTGGDKADSDDDDESDDEDFDSEMMDDDDMDDSDEEDEELDDLEVDDEDEESEGDEE